jgi:hypothetical protein
VSRATKGKLVRKKIIGLTLSSLPFPLCLVGGMLFALSLSAEAQQAVESSREEEV